MVIIRSQTIGAGIACCLLLLCVAPAIASDGHQQHPSTIFDGVVNRHGIVSARDFNTMSGVVVLAPVVAPDIVVDEVIGEPEDAMTSASLNRVKLDALPVRDDHQL